MRIQILSREPKGYSTRRLKEAAKERGHEVRVLDTLGFALSLESGQPGLAYRGKLAPRADAIVPRIGTSITAFGTAVVRQYEQMGVFTANSSHAISVSRDKLRSLQALSRHNIGIPATVFVRSRTAILPAIREMGVPVVIKLLEGTQGVGVILAESEKSAQAIVETLHSVQQPVLVQKFVAESKGRDVRAIVVGGSVVAAMRRVAQGDEFRSNVHRGGRAEAVQLDPEYERTAVLAAQIMGLRVAGVDMLEGEHGPQLMEVNSSPGLQGIERSTEVDVAGAIIEHIEDHAAFKEIDLKQRLTLDKGYGVADVHINKKSEFAGKTLGELRLRDREVQVLSIHRGSVAIPNPRGQERLLAGDLLTCYGKLITLKEIIPHRRPRKKTRADRGQQTEQ